MKLNEKLNNKNEIITLLRLDWEQMSKGQVQSKAVSPDDQMGVSLNPNHPFKQINVYHKHPIHVQNRFSVLATDSSPPSAKLYSLYYVSDSSFS